MISSTIAAGAAASAETRTNPDIRLRDRTVELPDNVDQAQTLDTRGRGSYIVQFDGPITQAESDSIRALGAELVGYVPDFAYKVSMTAGQAHRAAELPGVSAVGVYAPEYKLSPNLAASGLYSIRLDAGADIAAVEADIEAAGGDVVAGSGRVLVVSADSAELTDVAALQSVAWVENLVLREKHNEYGAGVILGANIANAGGYDGSTQIVAVADTGLGGGTATTAHPDIPAGRIVDIYDWPGATVRGCYRVYPDGSVDVDSGHGTHTSVSVLGDGNSTGVGAGTAPAAGLVFQSTEDYAVFGGSCSTYENGYYLLGLPDDLNDLLQQAYDAGARIHSDSWGSSVAGQYTIDAAQVDQFMWNNPDFLMTTSAGNEGVDADANGYVDIDSMGSPATAKNVLSVGASENDRQGDWTCDAGIGNGCTGQNNLFSYGEAWPADYPAAPISTDVSAGNADQLAAFSSRGPTDDGRIKPDVVAPGTWVLSGYSDLYQEGYDAGANPQNGAFQYDGWGFPVDDEYKYMGGTSMSNPLVAGAAAVVRDYYVKAHNHDASGALTKATLINSAVDLLDENNDGADDNDLPIPNAHEGWGRVDLAGAVDGAAEFVDDMTGVTTGATASYDVAADGSGSLKVTLVWADYPSTESAAINLVNDLDLVVTDPDGTVYHGNVFGGGWSQTGGAADRLNNVENVYVQGAGAGTWTVAVSGYNVPFGPQPFALVIDGGGTSSANNPPTASFSSSCTDLSCDFTDTSSDSDGTVVGWDWDFGDGTTSTAQSPSHTYTTGGTYTVVLTATDNDNDTNTTSNPVTVTEPGGNNPPTASFSSSCTDLSCDFTDTSSDSDGTVVGWDWDFGDGTTSTAQSPSHTYTTGGTYTVVLTATDNDDDTNTTSNPVTVTESGGSTTLHVSDLDSVSVKQGREWTAIVSITVVDDQAGPVSGAVVGVTWRDGTTDSCTTGADGVCAVEDGALRIRQWTLTVSNVTHSSLSYAPGSNSDPDGDSDGTVIIITKP
jgi:PKD repeat protein